MIIRYASAATSGTLVTLSLFYLMQSLIEMDRFDVGDVVRTPLLVFAPTITEIPVSPKEPKRFKNLTEPVEPNPPRPAPTIDGETVGVILTPTAGPPPGPAPGLTGFLHDGPLVAMIRVEPAYPIRASRLGLEGFVTVQFNVNPDGSVSDVSVLESSHGIFEQAAIKAARKFRFKARVIDGIAQPTYGVQNRFVFRMESG